MEATHLSTLVEIAADLRRRAGQTEPAFSTQQIVEACFPGTLVTGRALLKPEELVARGPDGYTIVYRRGLPVLEQRWLIAHAIGHVVFDGARPRCRAGEAYDASERRCDAFADELLAPLDEIEPYVGCATPVDEDGERREIYLDMVDLIASHFAVPPAVIDRRIRELRRPSSDLHNLQLPP